MFALEAHEPVTNHSRGFVLLKKDGLHYRLVPTCDRASHFRRATTAHLVECRLPVNPTLRLDVATCSCLTGYAINRAAPDPSG